MEDQSYKRLQAAFQVFMDLLQDDVRLHLDGTTEVNDKTTPFMVKIDVSIGVCKENDTKMKEYQPRLTKLLNSVQAEVIPIK